MSYQTPFIIITLNKSIYFKTRAVFFQHILTIFFIEIYFSLSSTEQIHLVKIQHEKCLLICFIEFDWRKTQHKGLNFIDKAKETFSCSITESSYQPTNLITQHTQNSRFQFQRMVIIINNVSVYQQHNIKA